MQQNDIEGAISLIFTYSYTSYVGTLPLNFFEIKMEKLSDFLFGN